MKPALGPSFDRARLVVLLGIGIVVGLLVVRHGNPWVAKSPSNPTASAVPLPNAQPQARAPLQISPERLQLIGVTTAALQRQPVWRTVRVTGNVVIPEDRLAYVQLRYSGWVRRVLVASTYRFVHRGEPLLTVYSPEIVTAEREYVLARQNLAHLVASTLPGVADGARSLLDAARARLQQWEVPEQEIARLDETGRVADELEIPSPVTGWVIERQALPNFYFQPETRLYTVADLSTVWVFAQVFQQDVGAVRPGQWARITVDAYPGRVFPARVDLVYPQVDEATRTVRVRLVLPNRGLLLKPGMYADVALRVPLGVQLVIPTDAVLATGTDNIVFVDHGGGALEPRRVQLGLQTDQGYVVLGGLRAGERVVTSANFLLDAESQLEAALRGFLPPPPGAGVSAAMNQPTVQMTFATEPSPPRRGSNVVEVHLQDAAGKPVSDAEVTVVFFMAAMPEMGMPAMRREVQLQPAGAGLYRAWIDLPAGGTWQVTLVVRRGSQLVASRQFSVTATGGM